jgi:hypothetical protein
VCEFELNGVDQFHCSGRVDTFDVWRTALFIAKLHDSDYVRVIGVDGKVGPLLVNAIEDLCAAGWLTGAACNGMRLSYEETDQGAGWFQWHHHHLHLSGTETPVSDWWSLPGSWGAPSGACHNPQTFPRRIPKLHEAARRRTLKVTP